jgi:hypothetical protein
MPNTNIQRILSCFVLCILALILSACGATHMGASSEASLPDFSLSLGSSSVSVSVGQTQNLTLSTTGINGFSAPVSVVIGGLPDGVTASPASVTLSPGSVQTVTLTASGSAAITSAAVTITATSGGMTHTTVLNLTVTTSAVTPDFSVTLAPASVAIAQGATGKTISVNAVSLNGFSGKVSVTLSGLPIGVTASPSTLSLTPGTAQNITLTAAASAIAGSATVTVTGTSASLKHTAALMLAVTAPPVQNLGFNLVLTPAKTTVTQAAAGITVSVNAVPLNGFNSRVNVALSGLPAGVTASPSTLSLTPGTAQNITLTAAATAAVGNATVTFTGAARSVTHTAALALTVAAAPKASDFTLSLTPSSIAVTQGAGGQAVSVNAAPVNGFSGSVKITLSGLPAGVTANPSTLTLTPGTAQNTTLTAANSAAAGNTTVTFTGISGSLTHAASLKLTVNAAPAQPKNFTLVLTPPSLALTQGAAGQSISVNAVPVSGFSSPVTVALSGLPSGVTANPSSLSLTPGTPQNVTLTAAATAATGSKSVTFTGTSGSLTHAAMLALTVAAAPPPPPTTGVDVTTYHYDNSRDGLNASEKVLTLAKVTSSTFGKIGFYTTDGHVDGEPLYLSQLAIAGGTHNVLYVVTENDSIYAFDADSGAVLWQKSALGTGESPSDAHNCNQISPEIGITNTPVIDRKLGAIFFVAMTLDKSGAYHQRLHALNLATGAEMEGGPVAITASYPGTGEFSQNGMQIFDPGQYAERVGLLLMNGSLFLGWTSHCDDEPYTGWLMMYNETTLQQTSVLNLTANGPTEVHYEGGAGAIWQSGAGLAGDAQGNIYFLDANGIFDTALNASGMPSQGDYGNAFMKVSTTNNKLAPADYFTPDNTLADSAADRDLGSGGVLLLPDATDANGATIHLAVGAGKDGNIYLVNRDNMGKFNPSSNNVYQELAGALGPEFGMAAYFNGTVYYGSSGDVLLALSLQDAKLNQTATSQSATVFGYPGTTPGVSANGTQNGIVWAIENVSPAVLHAYDASNLGHELYNSNQAANGRDNFGPGNKFITPMIVNGKVYVGTQTGVAVFGLLP